MRIVFKLSNCTTSSWIIWSYWYFYFNCC